MIRGKIIHQRKKFIPILDSSIKKKKRNSNKSKSQILKKRSTRNISIRKTSKKNISIKKKSTKKILEKTKINDQDYNSQIEKTKNTLKLPIRKNNLKLKSRRSINKFGLNKNSKLVKFEFSKKKVYKIFGLFLNGYLNNFFLKKKIIGFSVLKKFFVNETFLENHFEKRKNTRLLKKSFLVLKDVKKYIKKASYQKYTFLRKKELEEIKRKKKTNKSKKKFDINLNQQKEEDFDYRIASPLLLPKPVKQEFNITNSRSSKNEKFNRYGSSNKKINKLRRFEKNKNSDSNEKKSFLTNEKNVNFDTNEKKSFKKIENNNFNTNEKNSLNKNEKKNNFKKRERFQKNTKVSRYSKYNKYSKNGKINKNNKFSKNEKTDSENKEDEIWDKTIKNYIKKKAKTKIFTKLLEIYITASMIDNDKIEEIEKMRKKNYFAIFRKQTKLKKKEKEDFCEEEAEEGMREMADMFRRIILGSKVFNAIRILSKKY